jgi:hypothetical protein
MKKNLFFFKSSFHFLSFLQKTQTQKTGPKRTVLHLFFLVNLWKKFLVFLILKKKKK